MKKEAPDEKDEEDDVGEGGGEVDHLAAGLDSLWGKNCWYLNENIHLVPDDIKESDKGWLIWYLDKTKEDDDPGSKETKSESPRWRPKLRGLDTDQLPLRRFCHLGHLGGDGGDPFGDGVMVVMTIL